MARDWKGKFRSQVLPRSKRYEEELRQDICVMYLTGISTRTLSMISERQLGRKISAGEVSRVSKQLVDAVEDEGPVRGEGEISFYRRGQLQDAGDR